MNIRCMNCPDVKYRACVAPNILTNGLLTCDIKPKPIKSVCSQCDEPLIIGKFAYEPNLREFWCVDCLQELLESERTRI